MLRLNSETLSVAYVCQSFHFFLKHFIDFCYKNDLQPRCQDYHFSLPVRAVAQWQCLKYVRGAVECMMAESCRYRISELAPTGDVTVWLKFLSVSLPRDDRPETGELFSPLQGAYVPQQELRVHGSLRSHKDAYTLFSLTPCFHGKAPNRKLDRLQRSCLVCREAYMSKIP